MDRTSILMKKSSTKIIYKKCFHIVIIEYMYHLYVKNEYFLAATVTNR